MGDLKIGEGFIDAIMIRVTATGVAAVGLFPTCTLTRLSTGARVGLTVAEVSDGIYKVTDMIPAADDEYLTEWAVAGSYSIYQAYKLFKVGGGVIADWENGGRLDLLLDAVALEATLAVVDGIVDTILLDTDELQTDWADGGRLDLILDAILADTGTINWADITTIDGLIDDIIADIGAFPTANYATIAAYVEDVRTRLIAIVADTGELQTDWADGGRLDLLLDAVALEATLAVVDGLVDDIIADIGVFPTANYATLAAYVEDIRTRLIAIVADTGAIAWGDITGIINDIGVFPTANYATLAAYVEDIRTRLITIVGDTNEIQISLADGGFTDLLIDAIKERTDNLPDDPADASDIAAAHALLATEAKQDIIDTNVDDIETDTNEIQQSLANGGFTDLLIDGIKERTDNLPDDPADASDIAAAHALLATEAKQDIIDGLIDDIIADIGVFPSVNYATLATYVEDIRTRLIAIVGDTNELQVSLADGGFTDLLIDSIIERTSNLPDDPADASDIATAHGLLATEAKQDIIDTNVDDIETDTNEIQTSLADGGFTDLLIDSIIAAIADLIIRAKGLDEGYDLTDAILDLTRSGGSLPMNGAEQNLYINDAPGALFNPMAIRVDFTNMQAGDTVILGEHYRFKDGGNYIKVDEQSYSAVQTIKGKVIYLSPNLYGTKITIEQTAGVNRTFDWEEYHGG